MKQDTSCTQDFSFMEWELEDKRKHLYKRDVVLNFCKSTIETWQCLFFHDYKDDFIVKPITRTNHHRFLIHFLLFNHYAHNDTNTNNLYYLTFLGTEAWLKSLHSPSPLLKQVDVCTPGRVCDKSVCPKCRVCFLYVIVVLTP